MKRVELRKYRLPGTALFSGNPRGAAVRKAAALDDSDSKGESVVIIVPDDVFAVTASFFSGLLAKSIRNLGEEKFRERYRFEGRTVTGTVESVIKYASRHRGAI